MQKTEVTATTLGALRDGQEWAYNEVYCRYAAPLTAFLTKLIRNGRDAEEIVHDIFTTLWIDREKIMPERGIAGFLFQRAKQLSFNWLAHQRVRERYEEFCMKSDDQYSLSPDAAMIARETELLAEITVHAMSQRKQAIWKLFNGEGLSPDEVARRLGISSSTVRNNITEIKKTLREVVAASVFLFSL